MTIQQMQYYIKVCQYKSFTKAARDLSVSQPGISSAMRELERECGVELFERRNNSLYITDAGVLFLEEVRKLLKQYEQMQGAVKNLSQGRSYIRMGLATMGGNSVYPQLRKLFQQEYPEIAVMAVEDYNGELRRMLEEDEVDLVLCSSRTMSEMPEFDHIDIRSSRVLFCVNRNHPLADGGCVTYEEMSREPLVLLSDVYSITRRIRQAFAKRGLPMDIIHYTNQAYTVLRFIRQGAACGFLPSDVVEGNPDIVGIPLPDGEESCTSLFWKRDRLQFSAARKLLQFAKEHLEEIRGGAP